MFGIAFIAFLNCCFVNLIWIVMISCICGLMWVSLLIVLSFVCCLLCFVVEFVG